MTLVYIALGSNLASPLEQVNAAVNAIGEIPESQIVAISSFYRTPPLGPQDQPDYLNAAVALETTLEPEALLDHTQRIELQQGRVRKAERWGPRTLDLDIMLFGENSGSAIPSGDVGCAACIVGEPRAATIIVSFPAPQPAAVSGAVESGTI